MSDVTKWVAEKLMAEDGFNTVVRTPKDLLVVSFRDVPIFRVAVLGLQRLIGAADVEPLFSGATTPHLVINVPSRTLWSGAAIDRIHASSAAFGRMGDVSRAACSQDVASYRDKKMGFFINAMKQHHNVSSVSYVYDTVFKAERKSGATLTVAVIDAYNMSAEDVRDAKARFGHFDVIVKSTSYGSITSQANAAATAIGAQALTYGDLMGQLAK